MFERGTPLIVGDDDLQDRYIADLMKSDEGGLFPRNPIVKIRFVLRYPIQHAVLWQDVPKENAPVAHGALCRLTAYKAADAALLARYHSYDQSLREALQDAFQRAQTDAEREILQRHMHGDVKDCRKLLYYKEREL